MSRAPRRWLGRGWLLAGPLAVAAIMLIGCDSKSEWPEPAEQLPDWLYDAPYYYAPQAANDLRAPDAGLDGQIPHYYTRELVVPIKRPDNSPANKTPRLAVFWSNDHGLRWHKAGYFGMDSAYFSFVAPSEGTYSIRFVGPGVEPSRLPDAAPPQRVYHVDTTPPSVIVQVYPAKPFYVPGDSVNLSWSVIDANIDQDAKVTIYQISSPAKIEPIPAQFPVNGSVGVIVPPAAQDGGIRYAVEAVDKAGNIGRGFSFLVQASSTSQPEAPPREMMHDRVSSPPGNANPSPAPPAAVSPPPTIMTPLPLNPPTTPSAPPTAPSPGPGASPLPIPPGNVPPPGNTDRVPVVPMPPLPLVLPPTPPPASQSGASTPAPASTLAPVDQVIEPSYRPKWYPTTQGQ